MTNRLPKELQRHSIIHENELIDLLQQKRVLRVKFGIDPTSPYIHFGHLTVLETVAWFQKQGHHIDLVIGDYTAMIGDPSGRNITRPILSHEEIMENVQHYKRQFGMILDLDRVQISFNSSWLKPLVLSDVIQLFSQSTLAKLIERRDFALRYKQQNSIAMQEFIYPFLQAYDSIHLNTDIELGGADQRFNLLFAREMQEAYHQKPEIVMMPPLLVGLDGKQKMSKSLKNDIALDDAPWDMFGKIMSISDDLMWEYYAFFTTEDVAQLKKMIVDQKMHKDLKMKLAYTMVHRFFGDVVALEAQEHFIACSNKIAPKDIPLLEIASEQPLGISHVLVQLGHASSLSEAKRLIISRAVDVNNERITDTGYQFKTKNKKMMIRSGRKFSEFVLR